MDFTQVIIKPLVTEKTQILNESSLPKYVFLVNPKSNKKHIRIAFIKLFGFNPLYINTLLRKSKPTKYNAKGRKGYTKQYKVAFITIPKGTTLNLSSKQEGEE